MLFSVGLLLTISLLGCSSEEVSQEQKKRGTTLPGIVMSGSSLTAQAKGLPFYAQGHTSICLYVICIETDV